MEKALEILKFSIIVALLLSALRISLLEQIINDVERFEKTGEPNRNSEKFAFEIREYSSKIYEPGYLSGKEYKYSELKFPEDFELVRYFYYYPMYSTDHEYGIFIINLFLGGQIILFIILCIRNPKNELSKDYLIFKLRWFLKLNLGVRRILSILLNIPILIWLFFIFFPILEFIFDYPYFRDQEDVDIFLEFQLVSLAIFWIFWIFGSVISWVINGFLEKRI
ncbi:hypothetical protein [Algoriphagus taiwanensis]|uniref:Uncharacterized protein n=1 Tax=Algoriphagus taiwanensis TaxID=1445656 RepID=A0ABQ6Q1R5_9BACT|nr:hypothetical protein Ataiwa_22950 [Algoriphagus taiwanensis]